MDFMTLNWNLTASDCQVVNILAFLLHGRLRYEGRRWHSNETGSWTPVPAWHVDHELVVARHRLPDDQCWDRLRFRLLTGSGAPPIRRLMQHAWDIGVITDHPDHESRPACLCAREDGTCRFPTASRHP